MLVFFRVVFVATLALSIIFVHNGDYKQVIATAGICLGSGLEVARRSQWINIHWGAIIAMVIVMIIASALFDPKKSKWPSGLAIVAALAALVLGFTLFAPHVDAAKGASEASMSATPTPSTSPSITECEPEFTQVVLERHGSYQVDPRFDGLTRPYYDKVVSGEMAIDKAQPLVIEEIRHMAGTNAQSLASWTSDAGLWKDPNDFGTLIDGGKLENGACLSTEGQTLLDTYTTWLSNNELDAGPVPETFTGSGVHDGKFVYAYQAGINADPSAWAWTTPDGKTTRYHQVVCGNTPRNNPIKGVPAGPTEGMPEKPSTPSSPDNPGTPDNPDSPDTPTDYSKGLSNPDSQSGNWGTADASTGESTAPAGPSVSNGSGSSHTTKPAGTTSQGSSHGSAQIPGSSSGGGSTGTVPADGGTVVNPAESGTSAGGGSNTVTDPGSDSGTDVEPED